MSRRKSIYGSYVSFNPIDLTPLMWWSARGLAVGTSNSYGIVDGSGYASQWNDLSGNGFNIPQATASLQPLLTSSIIGSNSVQCLFFDTADKFQDTVNVNFKSGTSSWTIFAVGQRTKINAIIFDAFNERLFPLIDYTAKIAHFDGAYKLGSGGISGTSNYITTHVLNKDTTSGNYYINNSIDANTTTYVPKEIWNTSFALGCAANNTSFNIGYLGEVIVYDKVLTSGEITQVNNWLNNIYGIY